MPRALAGTTGLTWLCSTWPLILQEASPDLISGCGQSSKRMETWVWNWNIFSSTTICCQSRLALIQEVERSIPSLDGKNFKVTLQRAFTLRRVKNCDHLSISPRHLVIGKMGSLIWWKERKYTRSLNISRSLGLCMQLRQGGIVLEFLRYSLYPVKLILLIRFPLFLWVISST